jgi:prepilin-type N-terminal cleavage/methylation domain-containing protein
MKRAFFGRGRDARGLTLLEVMAAMVVLAGSVLYFGQGMIVASQSENKGANHTLAISIANYQLELMRKDPYFWTDEYDTACTCWDIAKNTDAFGNALPAMNDNLATASPATAHPASTPQYGAYKYVWRADQRTDDVNLADLTVIVYVSTGSRLDVYKVTGLNRSPTIQ